MRRPTAFQRRLGPAVREIRGNSGPHASKTDQPDQTDQYLESPERFGPPPGRKLTTRLSKLTSGPDHGGLTGTSAP